MRKNSLVDTVKDCYVATRYKFTTLYVKPHSYGRFKDYGICNA